MGCVGPTNEDVARCELIAAGVIGGGTLEGPYSVLTRLLCTACEWLDSETGALSDAPRPDQNAPEHVLIRWYLHHQKTDAARAARAVEELRRQGLKKLTPAEAKALGLLDAKKAGQ